ncbi:hypothetical protein [Flavobacterium sp. N2820]|nr:hypothetical protein [Flavobacterium sp. N2820]
MKNNTTIPLSIGRPTGGGGVGGGGLVPAAVVNCTQKSNINKVKILFIS